MDDRDHAYSTTQNMVFHLRVVSHSRRIVFTLREKKTNRVLEALPIERYFSASTMSSARMSFRGTDRSPIYRVPDEVSYTAKFDESGIRRAALDVALMLTRNTRIASHCTHVCIARETRSSHLPVPCFPPPLFFMPLLPL